MCLSKATRKSVIATESTRKNGTNRLPPRLVALVGDSFARRKVDPVSRPRAMWHRPAHRSFPALCHRPSGTDPSTDITSASPTRSLTTAAPDDLHTHTVGATAPARSGAYLAWLRVTCQHVRLMLVALSVYM